MLLNVVLVNSDKDETVLRPNSIFDGKIPSGCSSLETSPLGASLFISNKERELKYYNQIYSANIINNLIKTINNNHKLDACGSEGGRN